MNGWKDKRGKMMHDPEYNEVRNPQAKFSEKGDLRMKGDEGG